VSGEVIVFKALRDGMDIVCPGVFVKKEAGGMFAGK
jgi:hypothetical protein